MNETCHGRRRMGAKRASREKTSGVLDLGLKQRQIARWLEVIAEVCGRRSNPLYFHPES